MDIKQTGIGRFEFNHEMPDGGKFWARIDKSTWDDARAFGDTALRVLNEREDPPWLWALKQVLGALGFLSTLAAFGMIGLLIYGVK